MKKPIIPAWLFVINLTLCICSVVICGLSMYNYFNSLESVLSFQNNPETACVEVQPYSKYTPLKLPSEYLFKDSSLTESSRAEVGPLASIVPETEEPEIVYNSAVFRATAYCACEKCCGKWAQSNTVDGSVYGAAGVALISGVSVAIDNDLFSFGTEFHDDSGNMYIAADTGGAIEGYRIDVFFSSHEEAVQFGVQEITLYWE